MFRPRLRSVWLSFVKPPNDELGRLPAMSALRAHQRESWALASGAQGEVLNFDEQRLSPVGATLGQDCIVARVNPDGRCTYLFWYT
jgi:hypothetical protein